MEANFIRTVVISPLEILNEITIALNLKNDIGPEEKAIIPIGKITPTHILGINEEIKIPKTYVIKGTDKKKLNLTARLFLGNALRRIYLEKHKYKQLFKYGLSVSIDNNNLTPKLELDIMNDNILPECEIDDNLYDMLYKDIKKLYNVIERNVPEVSSHIVLFDLDHPLLLVNVYENLAEYRINEYEKALARI